MNPNAIGAAGGAVMAGLLDALVDKGILSKDDVRSILGEAQAQFIGSTILGSADAARVIGGWYQHFA